MYFDDSDDDYDDGMIYPDDDEDDISDEDDLISRFQDNGIELDFHNVFGGTSHLMSQPQQTKEEKIIEDIYNLEWLEELPEVYMKTKLKSFIKEMLVCQICLKLMDNVVELRCQHLLCKMCFKNCTKHSIEHRCPFCKKEFLIEDKQITQRVKTINFILKQLPVPCYICVQRKKDNSKVEESKNQDLNQVWEGKISEVEEHALSHDSNLQNQQQCKNQGFGCKMQFNDAFSRTMHEGTTCKFRWRRCQQCMKIYFITDFYLHKCEDKEFQKSFQIDADFNTRERVNEYFDVIIGFQKFFQLNKVAFLSGIGLHFEYISQQVIDSNQNQLEVRVFSQFIRDNILETIKSKTFNVNVLQSNQRIEKEMLPPSPKTTQKGLFGLTNEFNFLTLDHFGGTLIEPNSSQRQISFATRFEDNPYDEDDTYHLPMDMFSIQQRINRPLQQTLPNLLEMRQFQQQQQQEQQQQQQYQQQRGQQQRQQSFQQDYYNQQQLNNQWSQQEYKVFLHSISSKDLQSAEDDIYRYLACYGRIESVKIKGFGKTGKPFGIIGFSFQYSAENILNDAKRKGGFIKNNDFSCGVAENNR